MDAIRNLNQFVTKGSSYADIKSYLKQKDGWDDSEILKLYLKKAVNREKLRLVGGRYKIQEGAGRSRSTISPKRKEGGSGVREKRVERKKRLGKTLEIKKMFCHVGGAPPKTRKRRPISTKSRIKRTSKSRK